MIGPSPLSRWCPAARYGLPLIAAILASVAGAVLHRSWRGQFPGALPASYLLAAVGLWISLSAALLLVLALTHPTVLLDEKRGLLRRRHGLVPIGRAAPLRRVLWAGVDAQDPSVAMIVLAADEDGAPVEHWMIPHITWDESGYEGLRALHSRLGAPPMPPRTQLLRTARRSRVRAADQQLAALYSMPWRPEHEDHERFLADFDQLRRDLGARGRRPRPARARQEHGA